MTTKQRRPVEKSKKKRESTSTTKRATVAPDPPPPRPVPERIEAPPRPCTEFQYAIKLVQGSPGALTNESFFAPGRYFTAINIHNPSTCKTVKARWKVAVADIDGRHVSNISSFREISLRPDEALEIDSRDIARMINVAPLQFVKGFVVLESPCELDVVAVYTAVPPGQPAASQPSVALHTERVPARTIQACLDLKVDISTGVAPWTITSVPATATNFPSVPYQAVAIQNSNILNIPPWGTQPGALWVSARALVNSPPRFAAGWYVFQYCFTLCSGFSNPRLNIRAMVDDRAWIRLNGLWGGVAGAPFPTTPPIPWSLTGPPIVLPPIVQGFLPGRNCLEILVFNDGNNNHPSNPVGLNLRSEIAAERGACSGDCGCC